MNGQKTVDLLRGIRHDFGNHLQVIMGYLDLGNPQQARKYIIKLIEEMAAERLIFESTDADTALYLYQQLLLSRELGVILRYDEIKIKSPDLLQLKMNPGTACSKSWQHGKQRIVMLAMVYLEIYEKTMELICSIVVKVWAGSLIVEVRK